MRFTWSFCARLCVFAVSFILSIAVVTVGHWWRHNPSLSASSSKSIDLNCRSCHQAVWNEWEQSRHAVSWISSEVQAAFQHFGHDRKCESCHAPVPVLQTGLNAEVAFRESDRESGVNCLSCHARADGQVAARRDLPNAPCRPKETPELTNSLLCGVCHDAIHRDWLDTKFFAAGKNCQSCHMSLAVDRPDGRSHLCLGGHDQATVKLAATLDCFVDGDQLIVQLVNEQAGHNFPGERHNRVLLVEVIQKTNDDQITLARQELIKGITPFRGESSAERLRHGERWSAAFPIVLPATKARVRLLYKLFPWLTDAQATVVHEREVLLQ